jgi:Protein of unknown function (DUF3078)
MRQIFLLSTLLLFSIIARAQTEVAPSLEELKKQKADIEAKAAPIKAQADAFAAEIAAVDAKIASLPGWYTGTFGIIGVDFLGRDSWFAAGELKDARSSSIKGSFRAFANKIEDKYFWRNSGSLNLGWQKLDKRLPGEEAGKFEPIADQLNITSLYGYNITPKIAASALGEYRTSILSYPDTAGVKVSSFNNPGYLDLGVGVTYTPMKNLVLVFHPINYNFIFSKVDDKFTPSLGCKIVGDYSTSIKGINWRSNLTGFISYKNSDPSLHNGTWTNWFGLTLIKGIGVGVEVGLRLSEQEVNKLQNYYTVGLSYQL